MYALLALFLLVLAGAGHVGAGLLARRAATRLLPGSGAARGVAGVAGWYLASAMLIAMCFLSRGEVVLDETSMRVHVNPIGPAGRAGVRDGDRIVKVAGEPIRSWDQLRSVVGKGNGEAIPVEIERGGQMLALDVTPEGAPPKMLVGPWNEKRSVGVGHALAYGLVQPAKVVATTFRALWRIVAGSEHPELMGPVGIVKETSSATRDGFATGLLLAALLASYALPLVAFGSALYEILARRRY
jgi:regulator of sigma E protease